MRLTRILLGLFLCAGPALAQGGFLGVSVDPGHEGGARVLAVNEDTAAAFAGLREGDVIVRAGEVPIRGAGALVEVIRGHRPGDLVSITFQRGDRQHTQKCILGHRPAGREPARELLLLDREEAVIPGGGAITSFEKLLEEGPAEEWAGGHPTLEHALGAARESGKPVLLDFTARWCGPCQQLRKEVLHNERHGELLSRYEAVMVDIDEQPKLAERYEVQGIPDLRILAPNGDLISRQVGYRGVEGTVRWLEEHAAPRAPRGGARDALRDRERERLLLLEQREELLKAIEEARAELEALRKELHEIER